MFLNMHEAYTV